MWSGRGEIWHSILHRHVRTMMMWRGIVSLGTAGQWIIFRVRETHPAFYSALLADIGAVSGPLIWFTVVAVIPQTPDYHANIEV